MQIRITGHQMEVTDALRKHAEEAIDKVSHHTGTPGNAHVVLEVNKQEHICNITMDIGNENFSAKSGNDNMYHAIDQTVNKILRQVEKNKNRQKEARRR